MRRCPGLRFEPVKLSNIYHGLFALDRVVFQVTHRDQGPLGVVQVELNDECHLRGTRLLYVFSSLPYDKATHLRRDRHILEIRQGRWWFACERRVALEGVRELKAVVRKAYLGGRTFVFNPGVF